MPINVLNFEVSSGAFSSSAIYAPGIEIMGASVDPVEVAVEGAGEYLSLAMDESEEAESMMIGERRGNVNRGKTRALSLQIMSCFASRECICCDVHRKRRL